MFAVPGHGERQPEYERYLGMIRQRVFAFASRHLVPREADFAAAEEIAQRCIVTLWERYPQKRELGEMTAIAIGIARLQMAQYRRDRRRQADVAHAAEAVESPRALERMEVRETVDRFLRAMLKLNPRCRELLRLKLIEEMGYAEIRLRLGVTGNIYEMASRCHKALLRLAAGESR